jgi:hypothetical protein
MTHRNRWFTVKKDGGSFHGELLRNNQQLVDPSFSEMNSAQVWISLSTTPRAPKDGPS